MSPESAPASSSSASTSSSGSSRSELISSSSSALPLSSPPSSFFTPASFLTLAPAAAAAAAAAAACARENATWVSTPFRQSQSRGERTHGTIQSSPLHVRDRREILGDCSHGGVVGEVGDAGLSDLGLPAAEELLEDDVFDSYFVKVGANVLDDIVDDRSVDGGLGRGESARVPRVVLFPPFSQSW